MTLLATDKNYQNSLLKDLKDQCIRMNIKQKVRTKIQQVRVNIFSNQTLSRTSNQSQEVFLIYSNQNGNAKKYEAGRCYLVIRILGVI